MRILNICSSSIANFFEGILRPAQLLWAERALVRMLLRREIASRTAGTFLGATWLVAQPALQILGMWFFLTVVLRVRTTGTLPFMDYFLVGMICWTMLSEIWQRSTTVLVEFSTLYHKTIFPIAVLPLLPILVSGTIYSLVLTVVAGWLDGPMAALAAMCTIVLLLIWTVPIAYGLAVLGLFVREVRQTIPFVITVFMYLTPILYMPQQLPEYLRDWSAINPMADCMALVHAIVQGQDYSLGNIMRPLCLWLIITPLAWLLFKRSESHMREAL